MTCALPGPSATWIQRICAACFGAVRSPANPRALQDYRGVVEALMIPRTQPDRDIALPPGSSWATTARRLMCLRGIDVLTAAGLSVEIGASIAAATSAGHELCRCNPFGSSDLVADSGFSPRG